MEKILRAISALIPRLQKQNPTPVQLNSIGALKRMVENLIQKNTSKLNILYPITTYTPPQYQLPTGDTLLKSDIWEILDPDNGLEYMIELIR